MSTRKIKRSNLPENEPVWETVTVWLLLDRLHAPGWVYGIVGTLFALVWIAVLISMYTEEEIDLLASSRSGGPQP